MDQLTAAALLTYLIDHLHECDNTYKYVRVFYADNQIAGANVAIAWFLSLDHICDCEVMVFLTSYVAIAY